MILTKEQLEERLSSDDNLTNQLAEFRKNSTTGPGLDQLDLTPDQVPGSEVEVIRKNHITNPNGKTRSTNLSEDERVAIGVLASTVGEQTAADLFDVSKDHAHHLRSANRTLSSGQGFKDIPLANKIQARIDKAKISIQERAAEKLLGAFDLITDDKLADCNVNELVNVSTKMSQVMRNMASGSSGDKSGGVGVQIILHQPKPSKESDFETIEVGVQKPLQVSGG
jgi:hypothetical protein